MIPLLCSLALANGGPDDWTHATPIGSARPTAKVATRLVSETLTVTVGQDYDAVKARAVYQLHNPGPAETVRYAVPKLDELYQGNEDIRGDSNNASLKLSLDGKALTCTDRALEKKLEVPFAHRKRVNPAALENPPDYPVYDEQVTTFHVGTACEVELKLTPGDHQLVLDVVEEPLHYSWSTSKDKHPGVSDRRWMWLLAPAGSWSGTVETLSIDVDLGPHAGTAKVHGSGWTSKGTHRTKTLKKLDLKQAEPLMIDLGVRDQDFQSVILEMAGRTYAWEVLGAKASSTLKAQGANRYGPENLFDRDPSTAWCEGVDGPGVGEWVQLRYSGLEGKQVSPMLQPDYVRLQMALVPGYAKSKHTWTTNGRVAKVQVSACDGSIEHELTVPKKDDPRAAMFFTGFGEDLFSYPLPPIATAITRRWAETKKEACIQLRILEVEGGTKHQDTCISELAFLVDFPGMIWAAAALASIEGPETALVGDPVVLREAEDVVWWRREVPTDDYDNAAHCGPPLPGCAQPLPVRWERVGRGQQLELELQAGAHHFAATALQATPTAEQPVHTVAVRADDSYVGVLHELIGTPFVFAPAWLDQGHQTDLRLATDCVSLVIYGQRRLGRRIPYVSPHKLYEWLEPTEGPVRAGDVLHWGWQTAVVAEDRAPLGVLDANDELILAWKGEAERRTLGSLPFAGTPSARLRWPDADQQAHPKTTGR